MIIKKLYIKNFRNIKETEILFSKIEATSKAEAASNADGFEKSTSNNLNIFYGNNAEGKTNLLEAISLCIGKSFRFSKPSSFIPFNADKNPLIRLTYYSDDYPSRENIIEYKLQNNKPVITINDISQKNAIDLYGEMKYVVFIPEYISLIKGQPELRRDYIDNIVLLQNKSHKKIISIYKDILNQRNALIQSMQIKSEMLKIWDDILAKQGINLIFGRVKYLSLMKEYAKKFYYEIAESGSVLKNKEILEIYYNSSVYGKIYDINTVDFSNKDFLYDIYIKKLKNSDISNLRTNVGAHRDDIIFLINNKNAREYGSQGQLRSICLAMKLAEAELIKNYNKETPVLLLDEILSELDSFRRSFVLKNIKGTQCFITSCNLGDFKQLDNKNIWKVKNGDFEILKL